MEWLGEAFGDVNYWAVLVAVLSTFVVGYVWFAPQVFGKQWMKEAGIKQSDVDNKEGMATIFGGTFVFNLFTAAFLAAFLIGTNTSGFWNGALFGAIVGFAFNALPRAMHNLYERKTMMLTALQGGHDILSFAIMGAILGAWT